MNINCEKEMTKCNIGDTAVKFIYCKYYENKCLNYASDRFWRNWSCKKCSFFKKFKNMVGIDQFNEFKDKAWIEFLVTDREYFSKFAKAVGEYEKGMLNETEF